MATKKRSKPPPKSARSARAKARPARARSRGRARAPAREPQKSAEIKAPREAGRNVANLKATWRNFLHAQRLVIFGGVGMSVAQRLIDECGMTRRTARDFQRAAYEAIQEDGDRELNEERIIRYRVALERQVELASIEGEHRAAVAGLGLLIKMHGGFERRGVKLPGGGHAGGGNAPARLVAGMTEVIDAQGEGAGPVMVSAAQLTDELIAARERGEDV